MSVLLGRHLLLVLLALGLAPSSSTGEFGDVVLGDGAGKEGMPPVIFPHWFHRIRYTCNVCHGELAIRMRAGSTRIRMLDVIEGRYCGACHNDSVAWGPERCDLCHSARKGLPQYVGRPT